MTQRALAERAGLKEAGIRDLEQGRRLPGWPTVLALAEALGVDCNAFTKPPADTTPAPRGRPRKPAPAEEQAPPAEPPAEAKPTKKSKGKKGT
jgi:transcriptional regulator with XRE-family HTH domain